MFGMGFQEILVIAFLAVIFVGPKHLPEAARAIGKWMVQFKRASNDLRHHVTSELEGYHEVHSIKESVSGLEKEFQDLKTDPWQAASKIPPHSILPPDAPPSAAPSSPPAAVPTSGAQPTESLQSTTPQAQSQETSPEKAGNAPTASAAASEMPSVAQPSASLSSPELPAKPPGKKS